MNQTPCNPSLTQPPVQKGRGDEGLPRRDVHQVPLPACSLVSPFLHSAFHDDGCIHPQDPHSDNRPHPTVSQPPQQQRLNLIQAVKGETVQSRSQAFSLDNIGLKFILEPIIVAKRIRQSNWEMPTAGEWGMEAFLRQVMRVTGTLAEQGPRGGSGQESTEDGGLAHLWFSHQRRARG